MYTMYESPPADRIPGNPGDVARLRETAMRFAAELDGAGLHMSAAYVAMALDGIVEVSAPDPEADVRTDVELQFEPDEHGRVWMIREGDCHIIGRTGAVCAEMRRFLAAVVLGEADGP